MQLRWASVLRCGGVWVHLLGFRAAAVRRQAARQNVQAEGCNPRILNDGGDGTFRSFRKYPTQQTSASGVYIRGSGRGLALVAQAQPAKYAVDLKEWEEFAGKLNAAKLMTNLAERAKGRKGLEVRHEFH